TSQKIEMIQCDKKNITLLPDYFTLMDLKNLFCIKHTNLFIEGDFGREIWTYLEISFKRCKNTTENNNHCKSEDEISKRLDGGYFGMFLTDTTIDPSNIDNPEVKYGRNLFTT